MSIFGRILMTMM